MSQNLPHPAPEGQDETIDVGSSLPGLIFIGVIFSLALGGSIWLYVASLSGGAG